MTQANRKPDQRARADRADFSHAHDLNLVEQDAGRNSKRRLKPWEMPRERLTKFEWQLAVNLHPDTSINPRALRLACALAYHANLETGLAWPSQETLLQEMGGADRSQIVRALKTLREAGAITVERICDVADIPKGEKRGRDKRSVAFILNFDWAFATFRDHFGKAKSEPQQLVNGKNQKSNIEKSTRGYGADSASKEAEGYGAKLASDFDANLASNNGAATASLNSNGTGTEQNGGGASGPPSAVVAEEAPPLSRGHSSPVPARKADVVCDGQPLDFLPEEKKEEPIRSQDLAEQRRIVERISGEKGQGPNHVNQALLQLMRDGKLTELSGAALVAEWKQRGNVDAA